MSYYLKKNWKLLFLPCFLGLMAQGAYAIIQLLMMQSFQAAFDLMGIPYTGADYRSSAMAMDKAITKVMMDMRLQWWICSISWIVRNCRSFRVQCKTKTKQSGSSRFIPDSLK